MTGWEPDNCAEEIEFSTKKHKNQVNFRQDLQDFSGLT